MKLIARKQNKIIETIDFSDQIGAGDSLTLLVGRDESCSLVLNNKKISREVIEIILSGGIWSFKKKSSSNDVKLNGVFSSKGDLCDGDVISILEFSIEVSFDENISVVKKETIDNKTNENENENNLENDIDGENTKTILESGQEQSETEINSEVDDGTLTEVAEENSFEGQDEELGNDGEEEFSDYGEDEMAGGNSDTEDFLSEGEDSSDKTSILKNFSNYTLEIFGEYAPYDSYSLDPGETFIGRDEKKCQIILKDPEVSNVHAVIRRNNIMIELEDLSSSNGTIFNGKRLINSLFKKVMKFLLDQQLLL